MNTHIGELIRKLLDDKGLTMGQLAIASSVSKSAISKIINGKTPNPDPGTLGKLADALSRPRAEFYRAAGYDLPDKSIHPAAQELHRLGMTVYPVAPVVFLPVYGRISAGFPALAEQQVIGSEPVEANDWREGDFFLEVSGDSMIGDYIPDGARVQVRPTPEVDQNDIAAIIVDGNDATLKRVRFIDNQAVLYASNPEFLPQVFPANEVRIIGVVVDIRHRPRK